MSKQEYDALSDLDDEELLRDHSPPMAKIRQDSAQPAAPDSGGGHFFAKHAPAGDLEPAADNPRGYGWNSSGEAHSAGLAGGNTNVQEKLQKLKTSGAGFVGFWRDKTSNLRQRAADSSGPSPQAQTGSSDFLTRMKAVTKDASERASQAAAAGSTWVLAASKRTAEVTSETVARLRGGHLSSVCRAEAAARPCPRVVLVCCTALVTAGLNTENLFAQDAPDDLVHFLLNSLLEGHGAVLPPPGTSPHVVATTLKQFLITLQEPLLTYKSLPEFINAGVHNLDAAINLVLELPPANQTALLLILETCHRIAGNAAVNEMDAHALATVFAPLIAWHPPPKEAKQTYASLSGSMSGQGEHYGQLGGHPGSARGTSQAGDESPTSLSRTDLNARDLEALTRVFEYLCTDYRSLMDPQAPGSPLYSTLHP